MEAETKSFDGSGSTISQSKFSFKITTMAFEFYFFKFFIPLISDKPTPNILYLSPRYTQSKQLIMSDINNGINTSNIKPPLDDEKCQYQPNILPPQDRGRRAWTFLLGASLLEALTWGDLNLPNPKLKGRLIVV